MGSSDMTVCVTGMHRSGSSMVAGMLRVAGVHLGPDDAFAERDAHNTHGYWEDLRFVRLNDRLLAQWGGAWDLPPVWPTDWASAVSLAALRDEATALLAAQPGLAVRGWKDPRTCLTAAFWKARRPGLRFVVCLREPGEVSRSLRWRGFTSERFGLALWERYYAELLSVTTPAERIVTHYDRYFRDGGRELRRVLDWLGLAASNAVIDAALATLARDVRRSWAADGTADGGRLTLAGEAMYEVLCRESGPSRGPRATHPPTLEVPATLPDAVTLPLPPLEMRHLVGPLDAAAFDNPSAAPVFAALPPTAYESILDFGCGCGRIARQLIQQRPPPRAYLGLDLHQGMIEWCRRNLAPHAPGFRFEHHDAYHPSLNSRGSRAHLLLPAADRSFSLVNAWSVFTHLIEAQARHYLAEIARVLRPDGYLHATWFLFDKRQLPMMQDSQNALYINLHDPTNAVIFDRDWVVESAASVGLKLVAATPPRMRGYHWILVMAPVDHGAPPITLPEDCAPLGRNPPPPMPLDAENIGRGE
ncbi:MAG: methyltransferase domain-containing protein [Candidatus Binatia bacterium]